MVGTNISHYQITAKLGQGGMGEVYRATDTRLEREVAIKVLPGSVAEDAERLARFEREAKVLASLSHPNIAGILGLEQGDPSHALILELVEGEDLSERLQRDPLGVQEAMEVGKQIAEALEAAHGKGIVHRDLKPGNIKIDAEGRVKVLDFGLAKALAEDPDLVGRASPRAESVEGDGSRGRSPHQGSPHQGLSHPDVTRDESPTLTDVFTQPGTILGTAAYMSPEQARGKAIDKRSDIWAFGCVLFECLSGKKAFQGDDVTEILAAIIKGEPDWSSLDPQTPVALQRLLRRCLVKDRRRRLHDIADARIELEEAISNPLGDADVQSAEQPGSDSPSTLKFAMLVGVTTVLAIAATWFLKPDPPASETVSPSPKRSELILDNGARLFQKFANPFALSPNGSLLAYIRVDDQVVTDRYLHIRDLVTGVDQPVLDTKGGVAPFFSPTGDRIGFVRGAMVTQRIDGGDRRTVAADLPVWDFNAADWSANGEIVYAHSLAGSQLMIVDQDGLKPPRPLTDPSADEVHRNPRFLDEGTLVAYCVREAVTREVSHIEVINIQTSESKRLDELGPCSEVRYVEGGYLLCSVGNDLHLVPFDLNTLQTTGPRKPVLSKVRNTHRAVYDVARDGTVVYQQGHDSKGGEQGLFWVEDNGGTTPFSNRRGDWDGFALAPDEKRVALVIDSDIWILDARQESNHTLRPLIQHPAADHHPVWSPDGSILYFYSERETPDGNFGIWRVKVSDTEIGNPELIYASASDRLLPASASLTHLYLQNVNEELRRAALLRVGNIWALPLDQTSAVPREAVQFSGRGGHPSISPDGKWLAYWSTETGKNEVYVKPIVDSGPTVLVSHQGGYFPRWAPDGRKLYWIRGPSCEYIDWSEDGTPGTEVGHLWDQQFDTVSLSEYSMSSYTISRDGRRSLVLASDAQYVMTEWSDSAPPMALKMITHWFREFQEVTER